MRLALFAPLLLAPSLALASGPGEHAPGADFLADGAMTYALFERTIEHADLLDCPAQFDPEAVFCRLTLAAEQAHVFVFDVEGAQLLLGVKSYALDDGFLPF